MNVTVRFFARTRDLAGMESLVVNLPNGSTVADLRLVLAEKLPALKNLLVHCALALDGDYAAADATLKDGSEVALLPPVSGG